VPTDPANPRPADPHDPGVVRIRLPTSVSRFRAFTKIASHNYRRSQVTRMAAALSFRTIFGLIPVLVVSLVVLHRFVSETQVREVVSTILDYAGLTRIVVDDADPPPKPASQAAQLVPGINVFGGGLLLKPEALLAAQQEAQQLAQQAQAQSQAREARLDEWIKLMMSRVESINFGAIGIIGLVMLLYAAISMIVEIEKAFNQIADAPTGKSWLRRVTHYWSLLTLGPLLLVLSFAVGEGAKQLADRWSTAAAVAALGDGARDGARHSAPDAAPDPESSPDAKPAAGQASDATPASPAKRPAAAIVRDVVVRSVGFLITVIISTVTLTIVYTSIPNLRVQIVSAAIGAGVAALLWEASKFGFTEYLRYSTSYKRLYGVIALLPLFLLWVYVTWIVVLLGFQMAMTMQTYRKVNREGLQQSLMIALGLAHDPLNALGTRPSSGVRLVDPAVILQIVCAIAERFRAGQAAPARAIARATGLEDSVVDQLLLRLCSAGLLHRVAREDEEAYTLARAPDAIFAADVLRLGDGPRAAGSPIVNAIHEAKLRAFAGKTVSDVQRLADELPLFEQRANA
jgi:uncharacterized BrkB/YihY/UPF0761 family membrane protein/DNA-binding IscR family transcriptional regulator